MSNHPITNTLTFSSAIGSSSSSTFIITYCFVISTNCLSAFIKSAFSRLHAPHQDLCIN